MKSNDIWWVFPALCFNCFRFLNLKINHISFSLNLADSFVKSRRGTEKPCARRSHWGGPEDGVGAVPPSPPPSGLPARPARRPLRLCFPDSPNEPNLPPAPAHTQRNMEPALPAVWPVWKAVALWHSLPVPQGASAAPVVQVNAKQTAVLRLPRKGENVNKGVRMEPGRLLVEAVPWKVG